MILEPTSKHDAADPSSERWLQYYKDAKARRRARGGFRESPRAQMRKYRNRQRTMLAGGFVTVGILITIFYFVLEH